MRDRAFTLTELVIVTVVVAILAGIALPQYGKTVERARRNTALDVLQVIYSGERVYENVEDTYVDADDDTECDPIWECIYMDDPNLPPGSVAYTMDNVDANGFEAIATYQPTGETLTIDETRTVDESGWPQP
jgi:prepilin-type N-terminal cleavage/methylation domain-containing protein